MTDNKNFNDRASSIWNDHDLVDYKCSVHCYREGCENDNVHMCILRFFGHNTYIHTH